MANDAGAEPGVKCGRAFGPALAPCHCTRAAGHDGACGWGEPYIADPGVPHLEACPFCGGQAAIVEVTEQSNVGGYVVQCNDCEASTRVWFPIKDDVTDILRDAWNKRPAAAARLAGSPEEEYEAQEEAQAGTPLQSVRSDLQSEAVRVHTCDDRALVAEVAPGDGRATQRMFPIQRGPDIPWAVIAPFDKQCQRNHGGQSLERIAERGGLGVTEAIDVLTCQPWGTTELPQTEAILRLQEIVAERQQRAGDGRAARLQKLVEQWREAAKKADRLAFRHEQQHDGANAHAFRKERRIWTTCADELAAILGGQPEGQ